MRKHSSIRSFAVGMLSCLPLLTGGCPTAVEPGAIDEAPVAPGSYWVEQQDGQLAAFELPKQRGAAGRWINLEEDAPWFSGPAFYLYSESAGWTLDAEAAGVTLDEILQVHDPAPPAPAASAEL